MANGQTIGNPSTGSGGSLALAAATCRVSVGQSNETENDERIEIQAETGGAIGVGRLMDDIGGVLIVPGHYFFPGLTEPWPHTNECIRVNYAQDHKVVAAGIKAIAEEVRRAWSGKR